MKNSDVPKFSRPLRSEEIIQEGDLFWTFENDTVLWLEVSECYWGSMYDPALYAPMRRPIPQSIQFIREEKDNVL